MRIKKYKDKETGNEMSSYYLGDQTFEEVKAKLAHFGIVPFKALKPGRNGVYQKFHKGDIEIGTEIKVMDGESSLVEYETNLYITDIDGHYSEFEFIGEFQLRWIDGGVGYVLEPFIPEHIDEKTIEETIENDFSKNLDDESGRSEISNEEIENYDDIYTEIPHVFIEDIIRYAIDKGRSVTYKDLYIH